jgi:hypothetical protein
VSDRTIVTHPDTEAFAAYLSDGLSVPERRALDAHLAECRDCRAELVGARHLIAQRRASARRRVVLPAAVAAAIGGLILLVPLRQESRSGERLRDVPIGRPAILVVTPAESGQVDAGAVRFVWRGYGAASLYRVTLTDVSGRSVWVGETSDTMIALPSDVSLGRNAEYLWYVDALDLDGHSATSGIRRIRTQP